MVACSDHLHFDLTVASLLNADISWVCVGHQSIGDWEGLYYPLTGEQYGCWGSEILGHYGKLNIAPMRANAGALLAMTLWQAQHSS